jgi:hypothetical protein
MAQNPTSPRHLRPPFLLAGGRRIGRDVEEGESVRSTPASRKDRDCFAQLPQYQVAVQLPFLGVSGSSVLRPSFQDCIGP